MIFLNSFWEICFLEESHKYMQKNSNLEIFKSTLYMYMKFGRMPATPLQAAADSNHANFENKTFKLDFRRKPSNSIIFPKSLFSRHFSFHVFVLKPVEEISFC